MTTPNDVLQALAAATAAAATEALGVLAGESVAEAEVAVPPSGHDPLDGVAVPAAIAAAGSTLFIMPLPVAQRLAETEADELGELELGAVGTALQPVMDAVGRATGETLGEQAADDAVEVRVVRAKSDLKAGSQGSTRATVATLTLFGEPCQLVLLVPTAVTMRMSQTLPSEPAADHDREAAELVRDALRDVPLRVWAELGRARLQTADVAALGDGSIVELDHAADDPVDVYVNGSRVATGRLIRLDENDWAVRLEEVFAAAEPPAFADAPNG